MSDEPRIPRDKLGRVIQVGDFIVYGHALGRSAGLRFGRVEAIGTKDTEYGGSWEARQLGWEWRIKVQGVDDDFGREPSLNDRLGILLYPDRMLVVEMPEKYASLFMPSADPEPQAPPPSDPSG